MPLPSIIVHKFWTTYAENGKETDWVSYSPRHAGVTYTVESRISEIKPPKEGIKNDDDGRKAIEMGIRWDAIGPRYKAWKEGNEVPEHGTPLGAWPGVSAEVAEVLRTVGIRTVEEIADLHENQFSKLQVPNARHMVAQAQAWLQGSDKAATAKRMTDIEAQNSALKEQLDAAMALLEEASRKKQKAEAA